MARTRPTTLLVFALLLLTSSSLFAGTVCNCSPSSNTYWCSGVGRSCSEAQSNFYTYCGTTAETNCAEGVCSLTFNPPSSCTTYPSDPGNYYFSGSVTYQCTYCIDYPD